MDEENQEDTKNPSEGIKDGSENGVTTTLVQFDEVNRNWHQYCFDFTIIGKQCGLNFPLTKPQTIFIWLSLLYVLQAQDQFYINVEIDLYLFSHT